MQKTRGVGQVSLEYLLLLLAVLAIFAALLPLLNSVYGLSLFALDSVNAKHFAFSLENAATEVSFQADGASRSVEARPLSSWRFSSSGNTVEILVHGPSGEKSFTVIFPNELAPETISFSSEQSFFVRNQNGLVLLEHN